MSVIRPPITSASSLTDIERAGREMLALHPDLSVLGWHGNPEFPLGHARRYAAKDSVEAYMRAPSQEDRERFDYEQVRTALRFIEVFAVPRKTINRRYGSYSLKHRAEQFGAENGLSSYVANGEFILAGLLAGFKCHRRRELGPNCWFDMGFARS
ncbi:hypothetical protein [Burkholderia gladioli]|uniref:hypothetical protein n=1 Tax=Burkholderia gladioli TaxID=28095 RepID=UPI003EE1196D